MSTITDVAKAAGVSVATVSRALRGLDRVSPATRERVLRVAAELDYVASPTATSLASGRTKVVAVMTPFITRWYFATIVNAIQQTLHQRGYHVILIVLEDDENDVRRPLTREMLWRRVDGVVSLNLPLEPEEHELLVSLDLPIVAIGTPVAGVPCVLIDEAVAISTATEHLIDLGHRRIGYVGGIPESLALIRTPTKRLNAYRATLAAHDLPFDPSWVLEAEWSAEGSYDVAAPYISRPDRPSAIVAASDELALGFMAKAVELGLRVPGDLSVIGIDDYQNSRVFGLSTVRQDVVRQGIEAAHLLLSAMLEGAAQTDAQIVIATELIPRRTTAAPADVLASPS
ncbi:MAG: LacI family DNA-binding transcriptional regulator [Nostocoides sp.]